MGEIDNDSHLAVVDDASVEPASDSVAPPSPVTGYAFKRADSAKGGRISQQRAREKRERERMTAEDIIREEVERELREWTRDLIRASRETGNPAAFRELTHRVYGAPVQRQEIEDVTEREELDDTARERHARIREELKRRNAA